MGLVPTGALLDGALKALGNAERLLRSAVDVASIDEGIACFTIVMAWEEMGKALRLAARAHDLFTNEAVEIDARVFNSPEVVDLLVRDVEEFGKFVKSPLRDHKDKLLAYQERFARHRVVKVDGDDVTLGKLDAFQGKTPGDIVLMSRRSMLVDYFDEDGSFKDPLPMFKSSKELALFNLENEIPAVRESVERTRQSIAASAPVYEARKRGLDMGKPAE